METWLGGWGAGWRDLRKRNLGQGFLELLLLCLESKYPLEEGLDGLIDFGLHCLVVHVRDLDIIHKIQYSLMIGQTKIQISN